MLPYDPFTVTRPGRWSVGLRPLSESEWLVRGGDTDEQIAEKHRLLGSVRDACVAGISEADAACREAADVVTGWLGVGFVQESGSGLDALVAASLLVSEDLVVMTPGPADDGGYVLGAASLCFPTRWLLRDKIGRPMAEVHGPVPAYERQIGRATNRVFDALTVTQIVQRSNWSLLDRGGLHQPSANHHLDRGSITADNAGQTVWVRTEWQTLRRLPRTGAVLFTIRVFQCRLDELQPPLHAPLLAALDGLSDDARRYKSLDAIEPQVRAWLTDGHRSHRENR